MKFCWLYFQLFLFISLVFTKSSHAIKDICQSSIIYWLIDNAQLILREASAVLMSWKPSHNICNHLEAFAPLSLNNFRSVKVISPTTLYYQLFHKLSGCWRQSMFQIVIGNNKMRWNWRLQSQLEGIQERIWERRAWVFHGNGDDPFNYTIATAWVMPDTAISLSEARKSRTSLRSLAIILEMLEMLYTFI